MKKGIHPKVNELVARCACGNSFDTTTTADELKVTICGNCHPFYTGATKYIDTAGRIEKFEKKYKNKAQ